MQYKFDKFVIDPDNFELRKEGQPVLLRAKAFHVLSFLLKNRHRMVPKDELLDQVWHRQYIAESTLNSCIKTVRQVLGDDGKNQGIIQTVRGQGYRFISPVEMLKPESAGQTTPISNRLGERREHYFVGREQELQTILNTLAQPVMPYWVVYLYGSGGIGKSSLLKYLARKIPQDTFYIYFDCREYEPTEEGILTGLAGILSSYVKTETFKLEDIGQLFSSCGKRVLFCLDQFESFNVIESWIRQRLLPSLPDSVLTVIASRQAPKVTWYADSDWSGAFQPLELSELSESEAQVMLSSRQVAEAQISQVRKFARGYPLALELAAMLCRRQPDYQFKGELTPIEIVSNLAVTILSGLSDVEREAVEALSTVHRANEPILCALLGLRDAQNLFLKLRELPFINYSPQGIALHDVVRDAIGKDLSYRDPLRVNNYRKNVWAFLRDESQQVPYQRLWQHTADLLYLIDAPIIREAYFPVGSSEYSVQPISPGDKQDIINICRSTEPDEATDLTAAWLEHCPDNFYIAKSSDNECTGFEFFFNPKNIQSEIIERDPVTRAWMQHVESHPVDENENLLFYRSFLARDTGDALSPVQGVFWLDIKRVYMSMRPSLRRIYLCIRHIEEYLPVVQSLGFKVIEDCRRTIGGMHYHTIMCDFGENSIDGWLIRLVKEQLDGH